MENVASNAERRALTTCESPAVARIADIYAALPAITGKFELEYEGELKGADAVATDLIRGAIGTVFTSAVESFDTSRIVEWFEAGGSLPLAVTACKGGKKPDEARTAQGEILPGSASDAMLPLDSVRSQPPLAPPEESGTKAGKSSGKGGASEAAGEEATDAESGAASPAPPAAAPSIAPEAVQ